MIDQIRLFLTPVVYPEENKTFGQKIAEWADDPFNLLGRKAHVIAGKTDNATIDVELIDHKRKNHTLLSLSLRVALCFTLAVVLISIKVVTRRLYGPFHVITQEDTDGAKSHSSEEESPLSQTSGIKTNQTELSIDKLPDFKTLHESLAPTHNEPVKTSNTSRTPSKTLQRKARTELLSANKLIQIFDTKWDDKQKVYGEIPFNQLRFTQRLQKHNEQFKKEIDYEENFGFIEKKDLPKGAQIFVRADLHGDLKSLLENLKTIQEQGLLDKNFRCKPNVHLVFLGDYSDRGTNCVEILELLACLHMENPTQVYLVRGNHEYISTNQMYGGGDSNFMTIVEDASQLLTEFYETMSLSLYLGEKKETGEKQYVHFTHALFEIGTDPSPLLDSPKSEDQMVIPKERTISERIQQLKPKKPINYQEKIDKYQKNKVKKKKKAKLKQLKQYQAAARLQELWSMGQSFRDSQAVSAKFGVPPITPYNWGDVNDEESELIDPGGRLWHLSPQDVQHYLRLSSTEHKVKMLFRGHQHKFQQHSLGDKLIVSTLPVGMDSNFLYQNNFPGQPDRAYILKMATQVKDWTKRALTRMPGSSETTVSKVVQLRSAVV